MTRRPVRAMIISVLGLSLSGPGWFADSPPTVSNDSAPVATAPKPIDVTRFEAQIRAFESLDEEASPPRDAIVFTGSSSVKLWHKDLQNDFEGMQVIGRGFGGSTMPELLHFLDRVILKYEPRAVVVYEGDNDLSAGRNVEQIMCDYAKLHKVMKKRLPDCRIYVLAIKPSPSRAKLWPLAAEANRRLKDWCESRRNWTFVDVATPMLDESGKPRPELFLKDRLHLNRTGYDLWRDTLKPVLSKSELPEADSQ